MEEKSPQMRLAQPRGTVLTNMAVAALIIAALYFGREIFVPFALAVLLSFVMAPFVIFQLPTFDVGFERGAAGEILNR